MNLSKQVNMFTETPVPENVEAIMEESSVFDLDFDIGKLSVSPMPYESSCLGAEDSSLKMVTSDVSGADLLSAFDSISFDGSPERRDSVTNDTIRADNFDSIREAGLPQNDSSTVDYSVSALAEPSELLVEDKTHQENHPIIVYTSSRRRSGRNNKLNQNNESQKPSSNWRRTAKKNSVLDFNSLQISRRKRSLFSKRARSSVWGLLGNIVPDFEEHTGLDPNIGEDKKPRKARGVKENRKTSKDQKERKSKGKSFPPTGHISLKIIIGNQRCGLENVTESFSAPEKSVGEVVIGDTALNAERNLEKIISSDASVLSTRLDFTGILESSSFNPSRDHIPIISQEKGDNLGISTENRCSDSGASPDSEVINSVPDGPPFEKDLQNMQGSLIMRCAPSGDASLSLPGAKSKKGKKKDKLHQVGDCNVERRQIGAKATNNVKGGAYLELGQKMGDVSHCTDASITSAAKQCLKTYCSKGVSRGPTRCSRVDAENPVADDAEKNSSSGLVWAAESLDSQVCNTFPCINGIKFPKCSKANAGSKSGSVVSDLPNKKDNPSKKKGNKNSSGRKQQVNVEIDPSSALRGVESHLAAGNQMSYDLGEIGPESKCPSGSVDGLQIPSTREMDQYVIPRNAWVLCDECQKWRRIPAALADQIEETNCGWTCKQNMDKDFADCSVPQEKSNSEINEELEISDASCEEDACDTFPKSKQVRSKVPQHSSFSLIKSNLFLHRSRKSQTIDEVMVCHCKPPSDGRMGCGVKCLNRMLNIECVSGTCPCGELCSNQQFQKRKYAKLKWFKCGKKGYGLQALENISEGQFLIEYVGEVLDMHAYEARQREYASDGHKHFYFMTLNGSEVIDACAKGNLGRFINHSCDPNCRTEKWMVNGEVCVGLFALRDIKKGEEVTFDYNYVRVFGAAAKKCVCGSSNCRGYIGGDPTNSEVIVQGDSDDEYYEPVMTCEDREMTEDWNDIMLNSSRNRENDCTNETSENGYEMKKLVGAVGHLDSAAETRTSEALTQKVDGVNIDSPDGLLKTSIDSQVMEILVRDKSAIGSSVGSNCAGQLDVDKDNGESLNGFPAAALKVESDGPLDRIHSSSESKDNSSQSDGISKKASSSCQIEYSRGLNDMTNSLSSHQGLETTPAASPCKFLPDAELKRKMKYATLGKKDDLAKCSSVAKTHRSSSSIKKGKPKTVFDKGGPAVDKLKASPNKSKFLPELSLNNHFEAVEEKLNDLLDPQGGISKRKDASKGYLKLLFLTAASGNNGHGEAIQSNRELSMILDALLKTKSRTVLVDIINKNGLQMLHNIMKRCRKEFTKTPILRKLLKVLEYLALREILTLEHITGGPPRPGVESFKDSILTLTEHADKQVHQIARNFRDRWIPRSFRKNCCKEREDVRTEFHQRSYGRLLVSPDHLSDRGGKPSEAIDSCETHPGASGTVESSTVDHSASGSNSGANGTKTRKRKSRWDNPAEDLPHSKPKTDFAGDANPDVEEDAPPGFSTPCNGRRVPSNASTSSATHQQKVTHTKHPFNIVLGASQQRFVACIPISYGIPFSVIEHIGVPQPETSESWTVAPGMPFDPFPPLPPKDRGDPPVSAATSGPLCETVEKTEQVSDTSVTHHAGQKHSRTWDADPPEMDVSVSNEQPDSQRAGGSYNLGRKYFRQQKWNHSKLAPPWVRIRNGRGHAGNNPRNGVPGVVLGNGTNEVRNSYNSEEVNWRGEF